jgi:hypothetical protein
MQLPVLHGATLPSILTNYRGSRSKPQNLFLDLLGFDLTQISATSAIANNSIRHRLPKESHVCYNGVVHDQI